MSVTVCVGEWSGRHWSSVVYIHWRQVSLSLSVKVDVDVSDVSDCVCRWVKWTSLVKWCLHSLTSSHLFACHSTAKVTCSSLSIAMIAFYCWIPVVSYSYSTFSLTTQPLKSSCGSHLCYVTMNSRHNCTLYIPSLILTNNTHIILTSSRCSLCIEWLSDRCCRLLY